MNPFRKKEFAEGGFAKISKIEAPYVSEDETEINHVDFNVEKEYKWQHVSPENAEKSVNNFNLVRENGLKTETQTGHDDVGITYYRLLKDGKTVEMNPLNIKGWTALGTLSNRSMEDLKFRNDKIDISSEQWNRLKDSLLGEFIKAAQKDIFLSGDSYLFLTRNGEVDFIIGDFDNIYKISDRFTPRSTQRIYVLDVLLALGNFIRTYGKNEQISPYIESVKEMKDMAKNGDFSFLEKYYAGTA